MENKKGTQKRLTSKKGRDDKGMRLDYLINCGTL
jgi:hypothetical protein